VRGERGALLVGLPIEGAVHRFYGVGLAHSLHTTHAGTADRSASRFRPSPGTPF
jgi:hypothetical protein